jgi:hypothetical protein
LIPPSQGLIWVQPKFSKPDYELRAGDTVVGILHGDRGEFENQSWAFKLEGWFRRRVTVHALDSGVHAAVFRWRWAEGGTLELPEGRILHFGVVKNSSPLRYDWLDPDGTSLVHFQTRVGFDISEALVEMEQAAARHSELPLLVVLGEYLAVLFAMRYGAVPNPSPDVWDTLPGFPDLDSS